MKKENMNNKGFSLVELIIVIAIMAILIVVLAPQYLKYVERSRNSTDLQNVTTIKNAIETYAADPESKETPATFTYTISASGGTGGNTFSNAALTEANLKIGEIRCSSKQVWDAYTIKGDPDGKGGITWTYTSTLKGGSDNGKLASKMKGGS